jgi:hypothetical protein
MQMPQMAKGVFMASFIAFRVIAVKSQLRSRHVAFRPPNGSVRVY